MTKKKQGIGKQNIAADKSRRKVRAISRKKKRDAAFCSPCPSLGHTPQSLIHSQVHASHGQYVSAQVEVSTVTSNAPRRLTITRAKLNDQRVNWLDNNEDIHRLILSNENLTEFYQYCQRPNIKNVNLLGNLLTQFVLERKMDKLMSLNLSKNKITVFPSVDTLCNAPWLRRLDLSSNQIQYIPPESLHRLSNLEELFLSFNQISVLPEEIHVLERVTTLDIRHNQLTALPVSLVRMTHLKSERFLVTGNRIQDPPQAVLQEKGLRYFVDYVKAKESCSSSFDGFQYDKDYLKVILVGHDRSKSLPVMVTSLC